MKMEDSDNVFSDVSIGNILQEGANEYRKLGKFCDFFMQLEGTDVLFKAHKVILSLSCPLLKAWIDDEKKKGVICLLVGINEEELETIIEYLYTGQIHIPKSSAKRYYVLSIYFKLKNLSNFCTRLLIQNIQSDTCLDIWRFAVTHSNEHLKTNAFDYILRHSDQLLDSELFSNLTVNEITTLISNGKISCSEEKIYKFVMNWLNLDFKNRYRNFNNLIEKIRFPFMNDKFITSEVLTNDLLLQNKEFLMIATKILKSKLDDSSHSEISCLKFNEVNSPRIGYRERNVCAVLDQAIYRVKIEDQDDLLPMISLTDSTHIGARVTTFANNYLLIAGGENSKSCKYYCPVTNVVKSFPSLTIGRSRHGIVTLDDKILCCGGINNPGSVEVFDLGAGLWKKYASFNEERYDFGITTWDNVIYVTGGHSKDISKKNDPREDVWKSFPARPGAVSCFTRAFAFNNSLYQFTSSAGFIFDIRANKWMKTTLSSPPHKWDFFDLTEIDGKVYAMGEYKTNKSNKNYYDCCIYDIKSNTWSTWLDTSLKVQTHNNVSVITMFT